MKKYYTGIGSRSTPNDILEAMTMIAIKLDQKDYMLRSGGAYGADTAFANGSSHKEIYIPWNNYNNHKLEFEIYKEAYEIASQHHPVWKVLPESVKKLMARNVHQVLGNDLKNPSEFVICWTQDGCESNLTRTSKTGGTGLAISVAAANGIPIYNLRNQNSLNKFLNE